MTSLVPRWRLFAGLLASLLLLAPASAQNAYYQWQTITLPASSGASCGNGTPYRFFLNRALFTRDTVVLYEGGGACWDQAACEGRGSLSATNPNGVPSDYVTRLDTAAAGGLVTPFSARLDPFQRVRTQGWTMVYMPYCTGDVHTGSKLRIYDDANPAAPRVQHHRGQANVRAAMQWLRSNVGQPNRLLLTGFSAGGVGATATYPIARDTLAPTGRVSLLADSGPLFPAPRSGSAAQYPSLPLHNRIRSAWGLDEPDGMVTRFSGLAGFDTNNLGTIGGALAMRYPADRFGYMVYGADAVFSAFSYEKFYPEIAAAPDDATRRALLQQRWDRDVAQWTPAMASFANIAWHVPWFRPFNDSHCLTLIDFSGTGIEEVGVASLTPFIDNTLDRGVPMRRVETDRVSDFFRPVSAALTLLGIVLGLFGG